MPKNNPVKHKKEKDQNSLPEQDAEKEGMKKSGKKSIKNDDVLVKNIEEMTNEELVKFEKDCINGRLFLDNQLNIAQAEMLKRLRKSVKDGANL